MGKSKKFAHSYFHIFLKGEMLNAECIIGLCEIFTRY
nr:MAG TPA: hypothetical protein [Caudoviricetes sp.]